MNQATDQNQPAIAVKDLQVRYGDFQAVKGISFSVPEGAMFGLLGPNGGGKTSTFRVLSTLLAPSEGQASILGMDVTSREGDIRPLLGVVFQATGLDLKLTCRENLRHQGHLYGLTGSELEKRIEDLLTRFGLQEKMDHQVSTLSGGQKRRVEVAKGLLHRPKVLLLDEPTAGLDPVARREMWQLLKSWQEEENLTVVVSTHLLEEAELCDCLGLLDQGEMVANGTPDELKAKVGGDVISITGENLLDLKEDVEERFSCTTSLVEDELRIERQDGHGFIAPLVEAFPARIKTVALGKPTLEDVFVHLTGHYLSKEGGDA